MKSWSNAGQGTSLWLGLAAASWTDEIPEVNPLSGDPKAIASGKSWYRGVCSLCHDGRADGQSGRGNAADLRKFDLGFRRYVETVKNGRQIQDRSQGMPAWNGVIDDKTLYAIGVYLEALAIERANWKQGVARK